MIPNQITDNKIQLSHTLITRKKAAELLDCSEGTLWDCWESALFLSKLVA